MLLIREGAYVPAPENPLWHISLARNGACDRAPPVEVRCCMRLVTYRDGQLINAATHQVCNDVCPACLANIQRIGGPTTP